MSCLAIAQAAHPTQIPDHLRQVLTPRPTAPSLTIPITIVYAESSGNIIAFAINGLTHQIPAGSREELAIPPDSTITYEAGGSIGDRRYRITQGTYEFRSTAEGWALYKLPATP